MQTIWLVRSLVWINVSKLFAVYYGTFELNAKKLTLFFFSSLLIPVFAEKGVLDNQTTTYSTEVINGDCGLNARNFDVNNKKVLIATRHLRNDSKTIQLELRYDNCSDKQDQIKRRKHIRSNSCDVKIGRSNSRDYDSEYKIRRQQNNHSHSRNNSRDLDSDFRQKLTHSRTNSNDHANIKYILNYLKPDHPKYHAPIYGADGGSGRNGKRHSRNHSYDQIYNMPNNIKLDQELNKKFNKNRMNTVTGNASDHDVNILKSTDNKFVGKIDGTAGILSHSRNNSKDLNVKGQPLATIIDDGIDNILRHRRTNSKDLNRAMQPIPITTPSTSSLSESTSTAMIGDPNILQHTRNSSQPKIKIEQEIQESSHLLMPRRHDSRDSTDQYGNDIPHRL